MSIYENPVDCITQTATTKQLVFQIPSDLTASTILPPPTVVFVQSRVPVICNRALFALSLDDPNMYSELRNVFFPALFGYDGINTVEDWKRKLESAEAFDLRNRILLIAFKELSTPGSEEWEPAPFEAVLSNQPVLFGERHRNVATWIDRTTEQVYAPTMYWSTESPLSHHFIYETLFERLKLANTDSERSFFADAIRVVDVAVLATFLRELVNIFLYRRARDDEPGFRDKNFASSEPGAEGADGAALCEEAIWGGPTYLSPTKSGSYVFLARLRKASEYGYGVSALNVRGVNRVHSLFECFLLCGFPIFKSSTSYRVTATPQATDTASASSSPTESCEPITKAPEDDHPFLPLKEHPPVSESSTIPTSQSSPPFLSTPLTWRLQPVEDPPEEGSDQDSGFGDTESESGVFVFQWPAGTTFPLPPSCPGGPAYRAPTVAELAKVPEVAFAQLDLVDLEGCVQWAESSRTFLGPGCV